MSRQTSHSADPDLALGSLDFWRRPPEERLAVFARLRRLDHPIYVPMPKVPLVRSGEGFYALVRHADVSEASNKPAVFSNRPAVANPAPPKWAKYIYGDALENMDAPEHTRLRRIVSRAFAPRMMARLDESMTAAAREIADDVWKSGSGDFVEQVGTRFAVRVVCDLMGIPEEYRPRVLHQVKASVAYTAARVDLVQMLRLAAGHTLATLGLRRLIVRLGRERRRNPTGDVISTLVNADLDGERLTNMELGAFFLLLVVAGTDTPGIAMTHMLRLLTDHPEQRELLLSDYDKHISGAIDEVLRYSSPITQLARTVVQDYELGGHHFKKGDKVGLFYVSANRDEEVFPDPDVFDITRNPNPHVAFGGPGPHYCLGAHLAKKSLTVLFRELFERMPGLRAAGPIEPLVSSFNNGVLHMPYEVTPAP